MERSVTRTRRRLAVALAAAAAVAVVFRGVLAALLMQLLAGYALMALALPLSRLLEKRLSTGAAAALSFLMLTGAAVLALLTLLPPIVRQLTQLSEAVPALLKWVGGVLNGAQTVLRERGIDVAPAREELLSRASAAAGSAVAYLAKAAGQAARSAGKLFLAPLIAFYLLRDRRKIASALTLTIPVAYRARAVRAAREMRRETASFLRGQLLLSALVGVMTAVGLLATGTPGWLVLGLLMGVLELIPYLGPVLAGVPAVLLALEGGMARALWTLGVIVLVQQLEGSLLSPRMLSGATRLHPLAVLLAISAGGMVGGTLGMLLALPAVVSLRGAARGWRAG